MTLNDLLKRVSEKDYDKAMVVSDGIGWTNIESNINIGESTTTLFENTSDSIRGARSKDIVVSN